MNADIIQIPVEYIITTTSDWTMLEIVEGGWWQDLLVTCEEGKDRLRKMSNNNKAIRLDKDSEDEQLVVVSAKGTLNIPKENRHSNITYGITKGDIESTVVTIVIEGKKSLIFAHKTKIPDDPCNPRTFVSPVQNYLPNLKKKDKVFIVHGREDRQALLLQNYLLSKLKVDAIVFGNLPNKGRTIIEQIEYIRDNVRSAFVILTPDDVGCLRGEIEKIADQVAKLKTVPKETVNKILESLQNRARQNVVFEFGLFMGALGRENVCCLKQKNVKENPSDIDGILYIEFEKEVTEVFHKLPDELIKPE